MYLETLQESARARSVTALLMGAGEYGFSFLAQCRRTSGLRVAAVYARRVERGVEAFRHAGFPEEAIRVCSSLAQAEAALAAGSVIVSDRADRIVGSLTSAPRPAPVEQRGRTQPQGDCSRPSSDRP